jgi:uncharacterized protein (DUF2147 family)
MSCKRIFLAVLAGALLTANIAPSPQLQPSIYGLWQNPHRTVVVRTQACGAKLCGAVTWASPEAIADARDGGTTQLVGTEILRDYRSTSPNRWQGQVFLPDRGTSFYSTIRQLNTNAMKVSGCILGGLICKSQLWHRV